MKTITAFYVPGAFYSDHDGKGPHVMMEKLKKSGFDTVINWSFHVGEDGSISNQGDVTSGGAFVGSEKWKTRLADLKDSGSVNKLLLSFAGFNTFTNISNLIANKEHKKGGKLYNNFKALYDNMSADGIDLDDESVYDKKLIVEFSLMLYKIGFEVTFCPYCDKMFWVDCYKEISITAPNAVTAFNLQCYSGGEGNDPSDWIKAIGSEGSNLVYPGVGVSFNAKTPAAVTSLFKAWNQKKNLSGGFIWKSNDNFGTNTWKDYSDAIYSGIKSN